jgi:hypothetical protein
VIMMWMYGTRTGRTAPSTATGRATASNGRADRYGLARRLSSVALVLPRGTRWGDLTRGQRGAVVTRGTLQVALLAVALRDLSTRPAEEVRGPKVAWVAVSAVNYLGLGPLAYLVLGRRRPPSSGGR